MMLGDREPFKIILRQNANKANRLSLKYFEQVTLKAQK